MKKELEDLIAYITENSASIRSFSFSSFLTDGTPHTIFSGLMPDLICIQRLTRIELDGRILAHAKEKPSEEVQ